MRNGAEFRREVYERAAAERKRLQLRRKKILSVCIPCIVMAACIGLVPVLLSPGSKSSDSDDALVPSSSRFSDTTSEIMVSPTEAPSFTQTSTTATPAEAAATTSAETTIFCNQAPSTKCKDFSGAQTWLTRTTPNHLGLSQIKIEIQSEYTRSVVTETPALSASDAQAVIFTDAGKLKQFCEQSEFSKQLLPLLACYGDAFFSDHALFYASFQGIAGIRYRPARLYVLPEKDVFLGFFRESAESNVTGGQTRQHFFVALPKKDFSGESPRIGY